MTHPVSIGELVASGALATLTVDELVSLQHACGVEIRNHIARMSSHLWRPRTSPVVDTAATPAVQPRSVEPNSEWLGETPLFPDSERRG